MARASWTLKRNSHQRRSAWRQTFVGISAFVFGVGILGLVAKKLGHEASATITQGSVEKSEKDTPGRFYPTPRQWASLTVEPVAVEKFREELLTEGKIAVDEDRATPVYSPYTGRVSKLLVAPGDKVRTGQPLFVLEAADSVQIQNDFISASSAYNKARSQVNLTETIEKRQHDLFDSKATSLREWQQAQADLTAARLDLQAAQTALEANRNRLRIIGKTDADIDAFQRTMVISPETTVFAPLSGTVVQRKIGPGQYLAAGASDPVLMIGDLSTVWLAGFVRESDADKVKVGQRVKFSVLAQSGKTFEAQIKYVDASIDPSSRRRMVRAEIPNTDGLLSPEMFATVRIIIGEDEPTPAVPTGAVIYEGGAAHVWIVNADGSVELRPITPGFSNDRVLQVRTGLQAGEKIITKGSLFIDRMAADQQS